MAAPDSPPRDGHGSRRLISALIDELVRGGVTDAVTSPGSRNTPLLLALARHPGLRTHAVIDERTAGFVALGMAKASGRPVVLCCTSGSAVAQYVPAVVEAHHARLPLLLLTADRPAELRDVGAGQTIDQLAPFGSILRWQHEAAIDTATPATVRYARTLAARALHAAAGDGSTAVGPVQLNLPLREPLVVPDAEDDGPTADAVAPPREGSAPWVRRTGGGGQPSDEAVGHLGGLLAARPRAVVVAGRHEEEPRLGPALAALCELLAVPLLADPLSGARRGRAAVGRYDALLAAGADPTGPVGVPELVVRLGDLPTSKPLRAWLAGLPADVPQVHVSADGAWQDPDGVLSDVIVAAPLPLLERLAPRLAHAERDPEWLAAWSALDARVAAAQAAVLDDADETDPPTEPWLARELTALLPPAATLLVAASMPVRDVEGYMAPRDQVRVLSNRGANGIDGTIATAWGLALGRRPDDGDVVLLIGDVALQHDVGSLLAAGRAGADLTVVLVDNDGGGIFHFLPVAAGGGPDVERLVMTPTGLDVAAIVTAAGGTLHPVDRRTDLVPALRAAAAHRGLSVLHVRTDRVANRELHRRLGDAVAAELSSPEGDVLAPGDTAPSE
ncbi:2-succinyl-5-enolpyruvyl-6-hydroxy-3-cyclohexene-1-carboxylic-acid synthase [Patulibacter sp.]|uniref:2-succinyl-5-enolpyruvyl-6-hydroxy-3- cyclohexene-1-carboxylic-acid synthase n=1 Tax=Patulibacter sp. TaxID=1912859 RepID=UPI00271E48D3|nr:2-succinyl-5-enolpyruvyl-6-hydroxy-3-cyclohexene-1-carboxylic-acid synthase [Patulibacter sp.]MDO9408138.1 2-succinyl-5-enolpyruvyl-6-hydroxy-3-cyclohexene-1-carboxylic-acid synthase [Patulibacter sp.]